MFTAAKMPAVFERYGLLGLTVNIPMAAPSYVAAMLEVPESRKLSELGLFKKVQSALGSPVRYEYETKAGKWFFEGHVDSIEHDTYKGNLVIVARDSLSKLGQSNQSRVFAEKTLGDVAREVLRSYKYKFSPGFDSRKVKMAIQYQESDLAFLARLASQNGGQIWYGGDTVRIGVADESGAQELALGRDLVGFRFQSALGPEEVSMQTLPYRKEAARTANVQLAAKNYGEIQDAVKSKRKQNQVKSGLHMILEESGSNAPDLMGQRFLKSWAAGRLTMNAYVLRPIDPGTLVKIKDLDGKTESLVVRSLTGGWQVDSAANFSIEAAAPDAMIVSEGGPQGTIVASSAIVRESSDNLNRVRVVFPWDANETVTPWLRVTTPYWGDSHSHYAPPKKGDGVLVMWGRDDLDPIVLGSVSIGDQIKESADTFVIRMADGRKISFGKKDIVVVNEADGGKSRIEILPDKIVINADKIEIKAKGTEIQSNTTQLKSDSTEIKSTKTEIKTSKLDVM